MHKKFKKNISFKIYEKNKKFLIKNINELS